MASPAPDRPSFTMADVRLRLWKRYRGLIDASFAFADWLDCHLRKSAIRACRLTAWLLDRLGLEHGRLAGSVLLGGCHPLTPPRQRHLALEVLEDRLAFTATVSVSAFAPDASELGDSGMFVVTRAGGYIEQQLEVSFNFGGTAIDNTDYFPAASYSITFEADQTEYYLEIWTNSDSEVEGDETVILTLQSGTGYTIGSPASATVTIADTPPATITVSATDANAAEVGNNNGMFVVTRTDGDINEPLQVSINFTGTAIESSDYYADASSGTITFESGQSEYTILVVPTADSAVEGDETVVLSLQSGLGYTIGTPGSATVTIADTPAATITVSASPAQISEDELFGNLILTRIGGTIDYPLEVSFNYGGSATFGTDYYTDAPPNTITFAAAQTEYFIQVSPNQDNVTRATRQRC